MKAKRLLTMLLIMVMVFTMIMPATGLAVVANQVSYDGNGADSGSVPVDNNSYNQWDTVIVLGNTGNLVKAGYEFGGWKRQIWNGWESYNPGETFWFGIILFYMRYGTRYQLTP